MRTKLLIILTVFTCLMLTACGSTDIITGYTSGDVDLGQYKEVTYQPEEFTVTDDEVSERVQNRLIATHQENVDVEGKTVAENGDLVICDYKGFVDGVQFEGGTTENAEIRVGDSGMIPGFMEGIVGAEIGVEKEFDVTFPDPYDMNAELSGKQATFKVLVHRIVTKQSPEYTDELVASYTDYETTAEYNDVIRQEITKEKQQEADTKKTFDVFKKIINASEFDEQAIAPHIIENRQRILSDLNNRYMSILQIDAFTYYNQYLGMTTDEVNEYFDSMAKMQAEYMFVLAAVSEKENITVTETEIDELAEKMKTSYEYETLDEFYASLKSTYVQEGRDVVASQAKINKARDLILNSALAN
ncbi:MAG: trigger factor [Lachnospiraceae bacterium]|nr:trigger factor [Lachnospiraceae bacterium]